MRQVPFLTVVLLCLGYLWAIVTAAKGQDYGCLANSPCLRGYTANHVAISRPIFCAQGVIDQPFTYTTRGENTEAAVAATWARRFRLAENFLSMEMDRWTHGTVLVDGFQTGGAGFYPSNWMGDLNSIALDTRCTEGVRAGTTCTKITFSAPFANEGWAALGWAYPDKNFGNFAGRDITGATCLRGWIRGKGLVAIKIGSSPDKKGPPKPFRDPFEVSKFCILDPQWRPFVLRIPPGKDLRSVITGFTVVCNGADNPNGSVVYLAEVAYDDAKSNFHRLIRSYVPVVGKEDDYIRQPAHLYDNALCILAFLARNDAEGTRRARLLADAICWAQDHDRDFNDGRLRNAYCCGMLEDPATNKARIPGIYNEKKEVFEEDSYALGSDTGNNAWAVIALTTCAAIVEPGNRDSRYLRAAVRNAEWIEKHFRQDDSWGGYSAGFKVLEPTHGGSQKEVKWRSTEHNLDCAVAFEKLARLTGQSEWHRRALHARKFVLRRDESVLRQGELMKEMWKSEGRCGFFWTGIDDRTWQVNPIAPADAQTWAVLALGYDADFADRIGWSDPRQLPPCLDWLERNCRVEQGDAKGYRFSNKGRGIWPEGSAHLATCYRVLGNSAEARRVLLEMLYLDPPRELKSLGVSGPDPFGGIHAAYGGEADTGIRQDYGEWTYKPRQHIGATAWFLLAARGRNPYWLEGTPRNDAH